MGNRKWDRLLAVAAALFAIALTCGNIHAEHLGQLTSAAGLDGEAFEVLESTDVLIADVEFEPRPAPMSIAAAWVTRRATLTVVKSYKGSLKEHTTAAVEIGFQVELLSDPRGPTSPSFSLKTADEKTRRLRMLELVGDDGRYILFLIPKWDSAGWRTWMFAHSSAIPISSSLPLETPDAKTISESVLTLLDREWQKRSAKGNLEIVSQPRDRSTTSSVRWR